MTHADFEDLTVAQGGVNDRLPYKSDDGYLRDDSELLIGG